ncbi:hypothetical protein PV410_12720 [Streptomyces sp. PA03-5A]|nr:hypothetical protein [Streptomyces sp. PA03-5A]
MSIRITTTTAVIVTELVIGAPLPTTPVPAPVLPAGPAPIDYGTCEDCGRDLDFHCDRCNQAYCEACECGY